MVHASRVREGYAELGELEPRISPSARFASIPFRRHGKGVSVNCRSVIGLAPTLGDYRAMAE
jgi:hypothetical protein